MDDWLQRDRDEGLPTVCTLGQLSLLVAGRTNVFVRWSPGPDDECRDGSIDALTGVKLPGLSANSLAVEPWWGDRPLDIWVARRVYDYRHLQQRDDGRTRAWLLTGRECGRGPDNEPLVEDVAPIAWIDPSVVDEAHSIIDRLNGCWGPLEREPD